MRKLPSLTALPAFEATARLGSMKAAGEELGRTHGAVSKQIAQLGQDLGVSLFEKDGVGVRLTAAGEEFAGTVREVLDRLESASARLKAQDSALVIGISATFAMRWLVPRMPRLFQRMPGIDLAFRMHGKSPLKNSDVDVFLTWDRLQWRIEERKEAQILGDVSFGPVHAPGFRLHALEGIYKCESRFIQEIAPHTWDRWSELSAIRLTAEHDVVYPHTFLALEAAIAGLGIAMAERRLVEGELEAGSLVAPFGFLQVKGGFGAIVTPRGAGQPKLHAVLDWLQEELNKA